jgi:hypothetical protein
VRSRRLRRRSTNPSAARLIEIQRIRDSVPLPSTIGELYHEGHLKPQFIEHTRAELAIQRYHRRVGEAVETNGLPPGLRQAMRLNLVWVQIVHQYPWKVMWVRVVDGRRVRGQKLCATLGHAILVQDKIVGKVPNATIVSRSRGYDIPAELRGKLPPRWYWCPRCMKPRRYQRDEDNATFSVVKKHWVRSKSKYEWKERTVYLLRCPMCGCTNRDPVFRRSNQPWEVRKFKRGVTRAKRRR